MRSIAIKDVKFRRRREGTTNYRKRLALVKSGLDRIVVRKTNTRIIGQVVVYEQKGDRVIASADSNELMKKYGWPSRGNKPTAYLTGLLLAKRAGEKRGMILDIGLSAPVNGSVAFVFAKGCVDGGMMLMGSFEVREETYNASQTARYAEMLKEKPDALKKQFGEYIKGGTAPESLPKLFNDVRDKILKGAS